MSNMMKDRQETTARMANKAVRLHTVFDQLDRTRAKKASFQLRKASGSLMRDETEIYYDPVIELLEAEAVGLAEQLADLATDLMNATQEERSRINSKGN